MTPLDLEKATIASGTWLYDDAARQPVRILGLPYDFWYALAEAGDQLEDGESPVEVGPEGLLYYAYFAGLDGPGYQTVAEAKDHAQSKVRSPIDWS